MSTLIKTLDKKYCEKNLQSVELFYNICKKATSYQQKH